MSEALPSGIGGKKTSEFIETMLPSLVNVVIVWYFTSKHIDLNDNVLNEAFASAVAGLVTFAVQKIARFLYGRYRKNRDYGKYEGRWLQVIPDRTNYPYTIFDFKYNKEEEKYEIEGYNFHKSLNVDGRKFRAYRLLERSKNDGYYYITDRTALGKIGMGKLYFDGNSDGFVRAHGFFCDVDDRPDADRYETRMIKCDEAFCRSLVDDPRSARKKAKELAKMDMMGVIRLCQKKADEEIAKYRRTIKKKAEDGE